jgi:hypothetical protein
MLTQLGAELARARVDDLRTAAEQANGVSRDRERARDAHPVRRIRRTLRGRTGRERPRASTSATAPSPRIARVAGYWRGERAGNQ